MTDPWRKGQDPIQRWLRILTTLVCLGVFVYLAVDSDGPTDNLPTIALAVGALLVLLGYESIVRLPGIGRNGKDRHDPPDG